MGNKNFKIITIVALCIGVAGLSLAFASMSTTLRITGTSKYGGNEWNIHFANNDNGTVTGSATTGEISLTGTSITISDVTLAKPGDKVTYTFDVVNAGLLNAKVQTITDSVPIFTGSGDNKENDENIVKENYEYSLTYNDDSAINVDDELLAGESKKLKLTIGYKSNVVQTSKKDVIVSNIGTTLIYTEK